MIEVELRQEQDQKRSSLAHSEQVIVDAVQKAIDQGIVMAAESEAERKFFRRPPPWSD